MNAPDILYEHAAPLAAIGVAVLAVAGLAVYSYLRHLPSGLWRVLLLALRLGMLALLAWCLLLPMIRRVESDAVRPHFVVALDTSASMAHPPALPKTPTRWATASRLLGQDWVRRLQADCTLDVYAFDAQVAPPLSPSGVSRLKPEGRASHIRDSLRSILDRFRGQDLAGAPSAATATALRSSPTTMPSRGAMKPIATR